MRAPFGAVQGAAGTIALVHALKTGFALLALGPLGLELAHLAVRGDVVAQAARAMQLAPHQAVWAQWAVGGYALLGPLLMQWLLASLLGERRPLSIGLYLRALALSLVRYVALACAGAGAFRLASGLSRAAGPQLERLAGLAPLCAGLVLIAWLATAHDVAQAALAREPQPRLRPAVRRGLRATSGRPIAIHVSLWLAGLALFLLGEALARALPWPLLSLSLTQALSLGTTFAGAAWLAHALTFADQHERSSSN